MMLKTYMLLLHHTCSRFLRMNAAMKYYGRHAVRCRFAARKAMPQSFSTLSMQDGIAGAANIEPAPMP